MDFHPYNMPKREKNAKWPQNIPNGHKIYIMAVKWTNIVLYKTLENLPKLGFFGLQICIPSGNPDYKADTAFPLEMNQN
jgi:hypothetical protein